MKSQIILLIVLIALCLIACAKAEAEQGQESNSENMVIFDLTKPYKKPTTTELQLVLNVLQYRVTQKNGTERPFRNAFWDNKAQGIYVDIVSGEALFSSTAKFKSGTGWPSFYQTLVSEHVVEHRDKTAGMTRVEVRSKHADSHLGHLFNDGPQPTGKRYCINSASLRFVPKEKLKEQGLGKYAELFKSAESKK